MANEIGRKMAGPDHAVVTISGQSDSEKTHMPIPCQQCPWRRANTGSFPPEAFAISTATATDMSRHLFACHMTGKEDPKTCAGFLLSDTAADNMGVRLGLINGRFTDVSAAGADLFPTYRQMAVANGVAPNAACLRDCVPEAKQRVRRARRK